MRKKSLVTLVKLVVVIVQIGAGLQSVLGDPKPAGTATPRTSALINGQWFNGKSFERKTFYSVNGTFTEKKPATIDAEVNLDNKYIIPPFGESHNHNITSEYTLNTEAPRYFRAGIFYAKMTSSIAPRVATIRGKVNHPQSLDVVFGSAGLTTPGGHPEPLQKRLAASGVIPGLDPNKLEALAYYSLDSVEELDARWPNILASKPDFVKTMLLFSTDKDKAIPRAGLRPDVYRHAIKLAHAAGLRVVTHVETAADFALAVDSGADEIAHLPGYAFRPELGVEAYMLDEATVRRAARRRIVVMTTYIFSRVNYSKWQEQMRVVQIHNLRLLHKFNVRIAIGSDVTQVTALEEAKYLHGLGVFDNLTLLKLWCEVTPRSIFPKRKIARLKTGYEASFLALDCNPIENFDCVEKIRLRFKQGFPMEISGS